jgi:hypothetical protein
MTHDDFNSRVLKNKAEISLQKVKAHESTKTGYKFVQIDQWTKVFRKV